MNFVNLDGVDTHLGSHDFCGFDLSCDKVDGVETVYGQRKKTRVLKGAALTFDDFGQVQKVAAEFGSSDADFAPVDEFIKQRTQKPYVL